MNKKVTPFGRQGFLNIIIAIVIAVVVGGGIYMFRNSRQEVLVKNTGLSQEFLNIPLVKEYISDSSGSVDRNLLPFTSDNYQLDLRLVTLAGEWNQHKSSYFPSGVPRFSEDPTGNGNSSTVNYSADKKYALEFPINEHGGANLWDLEGQYVYQLCSHCGVVGSYWMDDSKFILLIVFVPGYSEDSKYHKVIQLFDLINKTISVSQSAGISDYESLRLDSFNKPANNELPVSNTEPGQPVIDSITPTSGPVGTYIELRGRNFSGFEGDYDAWIENSNGERGYLFAGSFASLSEKPNVMKLLIESKICSENNNYSGLPCSKSIDIVPGVYKIYTDPWGKKSNVVQFTVTPGESMTIKIGLVAVNSGDMFAGKKISCNDTVALFPFALPKNAQVLNASLKYLFSIEDINIVPIGINQSLENTISIIRKGTSFDRAELVNGVAKLYFTGNGFEPIGDTCQPQRVEYQIKETALQFPTVKSVETYMNGSLFDWNTYNSQR